MTIRVYGRKEKMGILDSKNLLTATEKIAPKSPSKQITKAKRKNGAFKGQFKLAETKSKQKNKGGKASKQNAQNNQHTQNIQSEKTVLQNSPAKSAQPGKTVLTGKRTGNTEKPAERSQGRKTPVRITALGGINEIGKNL